MSAPSISFAQDFVWGVATASYQIEGATSADGRGQSNWDVFSSRPGAIYESHHAHIACDHYGRLEEDLDLLAALGVDAYRFSVAWTRLLPAGVGKVNERGVAYYDRLINGLLKRSITPYLTLFHWDFPAALDVCGGWLNANAPLWFAELTELVARRFGDRVRHFLTINEPHAFVEGGFRHGRHAPGMQLPLEQVLQAGHHALLAHGRATQILRALVPNSWIAMAPVLISATPETDSAADLRAAERWTFSIAKPELRSTTWWMDPAYGRGYPEDGLSIFGKSAPCFTSADMDLIAQPLDAVGFNLYDAVVVRAGEDEEPVLCHRPPGSPTTAFNWAISPAAHRYGPRFAHQRYKGPIVITENGLSSRDWVHLDGRARDPERVDFIYRHVQQLQLAQSEGVPIYGYFHWSLLDNFEWNHGYRERFGLTHVDLQTGERTKKDSFFAYRDLIASSRTSSRG